MSVLTYTVGDITCIQGIDAICHQVNCLTVKAHGLSAAIAKTYPWADIYSKRTAIEGRNLATVETRGTPGDIVIYNDDLGFHVVCMHAQWEFGKCFHSLRTPIGAYFDTPEHRLMWFKKCLDKLGERDDLKTIAFPEYIGCGLAGGVWPSYLNALENFAIKYNKSVIIVSYRKFPS